MGLILLMAVIVMMQQGGGGADAYGNVSKSSSSNKCDMYKGRWAYVKNASSSEYPLYNSSNCPFIEKAFDCLSNGRPDSLFLHYSWRPSSCSLPRFNGSDLLRRYRGKSIMFVGDSLSLNQWQSLTCMLHVAVPHAKYSLLRTTGLSTFSFPEYNVSIMFSRNGFLVDIVGERSGRVLKLSSIENGQSWKGVHVLIFNTWHWWLHTGTKQPWDIIKVGNKTYKDMDRLVAFEKAMNTWAKWVESNVDFSKTNVFFQGVSPDHFNSSDWGAPKAKNCKGQTKPVSGSKYPGGEHPAEAVVKKVLSRMSKKVKLLDVTTLSQLRKDAHPSAYGSGGRRGNDCSHWCLPGLPDTWNQLLYAALLAS